MDCITCWRALSPVIIKYSRPREHDAASSDAVAVISLTCSRAQSDGSKRATKKGLASRKSLTYQKYRGEDSNLRPPGYTRLPQ